MFEKYLVNPEGFRNVRENNQIAGYEVKLRIPYYRGLPMSCVEVIDLTVDGEKVSNDDMLITVKGDSFKFSELPTAYSHRWEMIENITVFVKKPGGLSAGEHKVRAFVSLRISYLPFNNVGDDEKILAVDVRGGE